MDKLRKHFPDYVAKEFRKQFKRQGLSQYRFLKNNEGTVTRQTLTRILKGKEGINSSTLALYADLLGLDIIIKPQKQKEEDENQD